jgi:2-iminobutanoate/2-iminopropanoate deaminase
MNKTIQTPNAPRPIDPYNQSIQADKYLYISGQLAINPAEGKIIAQDTTTQTRQVMENIKAILKAAGYSLKDVVQTSVYLSSMEQIEELNVEYAKYFSDEPPAASQWRR